MNSNDEPSKLLRTLDRERVVFVISLDPSFKYEIHLLRHCKSR